LRVRFRSEVGLDRLDQRLLLLQENKDPFFMHGRNGESADGIIEHLLHDEGATPCNVGGELGRCAHGVGLQSDDVTQRCCGCTSDECRQHLADDVKATGFLLKKPEYKRSASALTPHHLNAYARCLPHSWNQDYTKH
jgi:hypothetical protein